MMLQIVPRVTVGHWQICSTFASCYGDCEPGWPCWGWSRHGWAPHSQTQSSSFSDPEDPQPACRSETSHLQSTTTDKSVSWSCFWCHTRVMTSSIQKCQSPTNGDVSCLCSGWNVRCVNNNDISLFFMVHLANYRSNVILDDKNSNFYYCVLRRTSSMFKLWR